MRPGVPGQAMARVISTATTLDNDFVSKGILTCALGQMNTELKLKLPDAANAAVRQLLRGIWGSYNIQKVKIRKAEIKKIIRRLFYLGENTNKHVSTCYSD